MKKKHEILILVPVILTVCYLVLKFQSTKPNSLKLAPPPKPPRLDSANKLIPLIFESYQGINMNNYPDAIIKNPNAPPPAAAPAPHFEQQQQQELPLLDSDGRPVPIRVHGAPARKLINVPENDQIAPPAGRLETDAAADVGRPMLVGRRQKGGLRAEEYELFDMTKCCAAQGVPKKCWHVCKEDKPMKDRFCPFECSKYIRQALFCSVNGGDYTDCCSDNDFPAGCWPMCAGKLNKLETILSDLTDAYQLYTQCFPKMSIFVKCARENRQKTAAWEVEEWEYDAGMPSVAQRFFPCSTDEKIEESEEKGQGNDDKAKEEA